MTPILKKKSFLEYEASNIDEDFEILYGKSPINSLSITPHKEFQGILMQSSFQSIRLNKKPKININQLIELQSTSGLIAEEKTYEFNTHMPNDLLFSSYRKENLIQEGERSPANPNNKIRVSEDLLLNIPQGDASFIPLNKDFTKDPMASSNIVTPKTSFKKLEEFPSFVNNTPQNFKTNDLFYTEARFLKDLFKHSKEANLDLLFEVLVLCQGCKILPYNEKPHSQIPVPQQGPSIFFGGFQGHQMPNQAFLQGFPEKPPFSPSDTATGSGRIMEARSKEEEVLVEFAKNCGFVYERAEPSENPTHYHTKMKGHRLVYNIFGINEFSHQKKSFSIVLKSPLKDEIFLLCKGQEDYMRARLYLEKHEEETLDLVLRDMHCRGLKPVIYARKDLPEVEALTYLNKTKHLKSSLINQSEELTALALELERDMTPICIIGLKDELNEGIDNLIDFSKDAGINVWMLTGDSKENALSISSNIGLFDSSYDKAKELVAEDPETLLLQLRGHLIEIKNIYMLNFFEMMDGSRKSVDVSKKSLRKSFTKSIEDYFMQKFEMWRTASRETNGKFLELKSRLSKFYLVINGKSLDLIYKDEYLKPHFVFLLSLFKKVVAYNLTPRHKYLLTETVQNSFVDNPSVMAIGDGPNDCLMLQTAHIGVEFLKDVNDSRGFLSQPKLNAGDIQINSLKVLKQLMLCEGVMRLTLVENFVYFLFYKSFLLGWTVFLYNWFCSFTGTAVYSSIMVFLYSFLFLSFCLTIYVFFDRPISEPLLLRYPALYKETLLKKRNPLLRLVIKSLIEGLIHGFIMFFICKLGIEETVLENGINSDLTMLSFSLLTCVVFIPNVKILFICLGHNLKIIILAFLLTILIYAAFIFLGSHSLIGRPEWGTAYAYLLNNCNGICVIIFNIWISQLISFVYERYILKKILYSPVKEKLADFNYLKKLTNQQIVKDLELPM